MKIGFIVNAMYTPVSGQTTYRLAAEAVNQGHEVWIASTGNFSYDPDDKIRARARAVPAGSYNTVESFIQAFQSKSARNRWVVLDDLDILFLRSNPSVQSSWAQQAAIHFGRMAMRHGVTVLNDPNGLAKALNKMYLQTFPEQVRPAALITRNRRRIEKFADQQGTIVIKPLMGSGGRNVFIVRPNDRPNLKQMIEAVSRDGYVMAQEYLPAAAKGDMRLFVMNGHPLRCNGQYAAFRRVRSGGDMRSNIHAGGKLRRAKVTDVALELADAIRPRLVEDGMFLVGLDIVGNKLMEINVFSPGGLGSAQLFEKVDFNKPVIAALERKVQYARGAQRKPSNTELASL
jgi:glutathione synthase